MLKKISPTEYKRQHTALHQWFIIMPPKNSFKKLFIGTKLGEALQKISSAKSIFDGLKMVECEHKNYPIDYILGQDLVQDALEKNKKTMYFKLSFPTLQTS